MLTRLHDLQYDNREDEVELDDRVEVIQTEMARQIDTLTEDFNKREKVRKDKALKILMNLIDNKIPVYVLTKTEYVDRYWGKLESYKVKEFVGNSGGHKIVSNDVYFKFCRISASVSYGEYQATDYFLAEVNRSFNPLTEEFTVNQKKAEDENREVEERYL